MSNVSEFAKLMNKALAEKTARLEEDRVRKELEVAPLLTELFQVVAKSKNIASRNDQDNPRYIKEEISIGSSSLPKESIQDDPSEKSFTKILNKLQSEIANLQRQINTRQNIQSGWGTSGSGEVRVLRMDDVNTDNLEQDASLTYNSTDKMLHFTQPYDKVFSNVINKPTIINEDMSYVVIGYLKVHNTLYIKGNLGII